MSAGVGPAIGAAIVAAAAAAGIVYGLVRARSDWFAGTSSRAEEKRAEVDELLRIKDEMIEALNLQVARAIEREGRWQADREDLQGRLSRIEDRYLSLVDQVAASGLCMIAASCPNVVRPGVDPAGATLTG